MIHLESVLFAPKSAATDSFPFTVPSILALKERPLLFSSPVTILVGENGSGKSTFIEAIACAAKSITVGSDAVESDDSLTGAQRLANCLKVAWRHKTRKGFFLRAEDFFGFAKRMNSIRSEAERALCAVREDSSLSETAKAYGSMPHARTIGEIDSRYGAGLDACSHGESFLKLFESRLVPEGLYLLDEPEAPLSPKRQLALISLVKQVVEHEEGQFIIATHSPLLMAIPGATILSFDEGTIREVKYEEVEHVTLTRDFLANPMRFLRHL